jgi:hypothetical protein
VPGHPLAAVACGAESHLQGADNVDVAMVGAAALALDGRHDDAARRCADALAAAEPGAAGRIIPVDPLLNALGHREAWAQTLIALRDRAA